MSVKHGLRGSPFSEDGASRLAKLGVQEATAKAVVARLLDGHAKKDHAVQPDDDLYRVYGIVEDDLDELVVRLCQDLYGFEPATSDGDGFKPVRTVVDLARFVDYLAKRRRPQQT